MPQQLKKYVCHNSEVLLYTGEPNLELLDDLARGPGDLWHSALDQGFKNLFLEVQYQTAVFWWFLNDFDDLSQCVSWRINPYCFVVREKVWETFGGFPADYASAVTSALDLGFRLLRYGGGIPLHVDGLYEPIKGNHRISAEDRYIFFRKNFKKRHLYYMFLRELRNNPLREWKAYIKSEKINPGKNSFPVISKRALLSIEREIKVSVVIPTMNRQDFVFQLLKDFQNQSYPVHEVVIVDATQPKDRKEIYNEATLNYKLIVKWQESKGSCRARNEAIKLCTGEYIIFADDDIRVPSDFVENHLKYLKTYNAEACTGLDITASSISDDLEDLATKYSYLPEKIKHAGATQHFSNANSCVKKEWVDKLHGNDVRFDGGYGEDSDFGLRLLKQGVILLYNPFAVNLHLKPSFGGYADWKKESSFVGKKRKVQMWEGDKPVKYIRPVPSPTVLYGIMKGFKPDQVNEYYYKYLFLYLFKNSSENFLQKVIKLPLKILQLRRSVIYARLLFEKGESFESQ
ncbi:glycosyltransferase [Salinimicrobium catena]|uniref:glycosyltransferase family 2 protein n=1 Tax=Salinimicrobium catena TaxID=390640 RepID=UPI002FE4B97E